MDKQEKDRANKIFEDVFQKENVYNKFLPNASELHDESLIVLEDIKTNLSLSVSKHEIRPGCEIWTKRFRKYLKFYGFKFSKEDHLNFIRLFYELLLIPYLEPHLFGEFAQMLRKLLKKRELISPQELVLEWKPLYKLCKTLLFSSRVDIGMYGYSSTLEEDFILVIHAARLYFPVTATQEMLNEWKPMLCPLDNTTLDNTIRLMTYFLPIYVHPSLASKGYKLWFEDIMIFWEVCNSSSTWEGNIMDLMSFLAENNIGFIDWEPYIPMMFNRFLNCFQLPVSYKNVNVIERFHWDVSAIACWIVSVLGGGSITQKYLDNLMALLESYFHPVNSGRWTNNLLKLLQGLSYHFIKRLNFERHKKLTWETPVPEKNKLKEEDITLFVQSLKSVALRAMMTENGEVKVSLQFLATLRPSLIVPEIIEYFYSTLETTTNPSKYRAVLQCLTAVMRPILDCSDPTAKGQTHVIPLLCAVMPGIDPNDWEKSISSLQFIDTVVSMIPIVDCSNAAQFHKNIKDEERNLCVETANFENLILEYFERCYLIISSSSSLDSTRLEQAADKQSKFENLAQEALLTTCSTVLRQLSTQIFKSALAKLHSFVRENILETKVAGRLLAGIMQSYVQANAVSTLELFIPFLSNNILHSSSLDDISANVAPSSEFLFYLQLISKIVNCPGKYLLPYVSQLNEVLKKCLQITSRDGFTMASSLLHDLIKNLLSTVPLEYHSTNCLLDVSIKDYLLTKDWGKPGNIDDLNMHFFTPTEKETKSVRIIVNSHLPPQLKFIKTLLSSASPKIDEKLEYCLEIIKALLECRSMLPDGEKDIIQLVDTCLIRGNVPPSSSLDNKSNEKESDPIMFNLRKDLVNLLEKLQAVILTLKEYDTKSLIILTKIWFLLLSNNNFNKVNHEIHFKNYRTLKSSLENKLVGEKKHPRFLLIARIQLQHEMLQDRKYPYFTSMHKQIMMNLLTLSASNYSDVRREARAKLNLALERFPYSYTILISKLCEYLTKDAIKEHGVFEGALRVLLGPTNHPILVQHDYSVLQSLWPVVIKARPEKESILTLLDIIEEIVEDEFGTMTINLEISDLCVENALKLVKSSESMQQIHERRREIQQEHFQKNFNQYVSLLRSLVNVIQNENLHCRFQCLALNLLMALIHPNVPYPSDVVKCFLEFLINDSIEIRKYGILAVIMVLKQQKRMLKKVSIDPYKFVHKDEVPSVDYPGDRIDNQWIKYKVKHLPENKPDWENMTFLHREYHGFYCWPKTLMVYASSNNQLLFQANSSPSNEEKEIINFFSETSNINKLLSFLSMEEKKGEDKFFEDRYLLFKGLFRNGGYEALKIFITPLQKLVISPQESCQRCAAEIIAGAVRGAKHWPYEMVSKAWNSLTPIIRDVLHHMNEETVNDWKTCFALSSENRDPRWNYRLFKVLFEDQIQHNSSFVEAKRIYFIESAMAFHLWKLSELLTVWLELLKKRLSHSFQNVRNHVGEALSRIFEADMKFPKGNSPNTPHISEFISYVLPSISRLYNMALNEVGQSSESNQQSKNANTETKPSQILSSEHVSEIRLMKTICVWLSTMMDRSAFGVSSDFYHLFPTICLMENFKSDNELRQLCTSALGKLAHSTHLTSHMTSALTAIKKASQCPSWQGRVTCTEYLQVFVFYNMPIILANQMWTDEIRNLVLQLLEDKYLEVREKSAEVLCGLLHTGFIEDKFKLLAMFKEKVTTIKGKKTQNVDQTTLRLCHSSLLGLCAFIDAYPYDVPDFIPDLFVILHKHLSDPHPIPVTIRKTICNFQRTHHDNWPLFRHKFNEEQLAILADLTTGPTYYA